LLKNNLEILLYFISELRKTKRISVTILCYLAETLTASFLFNWMGQILLDASYVDVLGVHHIIKSYMWPKATGCATSSL
jgi:hypothetical protein